jgi:hypothetical protein
MKFLYPCLIYIIVLTFLSCDNKSAIETRTTKRKIISSSKELLNDTVIVELQWYPISCPCAQWITTKNLNKVTLNNDENLLAEDSILIDIELN